MKITLIVAVLSILFFGCSRPEKDATSYEEGYLDVDNGVRIFYQKVEEGMGYSITQCTAD